MITTRTQRGKTWKIWSRTDGRCYYCGCSLEFSTFHRDHVVPRAQGGSSAVQNLVASCPRCNLAKAKKTPEEFRAWLIVWASRQLAEVEERLAIFQYQPGDRLSFLLTRLSDLAYEIECLEPLMFYFETLENKET